MRRPVPDYLISNLFCTGVHLTEDGEILVPLVAEEGTHTVTILQNGQTTYEADEVF